VSDDAGSEVSDGWERALRHLGESESEHGRTAPRTGAKKPAAGVESRTTAPDGRARTGAVAGTVAVCIRAFLTLIWTLAFAGALAGGNWAFAVLALVLGSLSGFWLSQNLSDRRARSK
jgi:hypothetical protein